MKTPRTRIVRLTRARSHEGDTLFFTYAGGGGRGNSRTSFIAKDHVPPFEGETGWFEIEHAPCKPWGFDRALRRVDPPERG